MMSPQHPDASSQPEGNRVAENLSKKKRTLAQLRALPKSTNRPLIPRQPRTEGRSFPLSPAQERLWFLQQLEPENRSYQAFFGIRIGGQLCIATLEQSLKEIVRRHEILRTRFHTEDGDPRQTILSNLMLHLPVVDVTALPSELKIQQPWIDSPDSLSFDLTAPPLIRMFLVRYSRTQHILIYGMHHIISDGWSMSIVIQELSQLYPASVEGKPSPLPELPRQYVDFAVWQREHLDNERQERQLAYWKNRLEGVSTLSQIPTDHPRPAVQSFRGSAHPISLPPELVRKLKDLSRNRGVTPFMTLVAALKVVLFRYSGESDITIGTPIANRTRNELEGLIGMFVNTLALRTELTGELSFSQLLDRVREATLGAYEHQDTPFEKIVEEIAPKRSLGHNPIFQVMLGLLNMPVAELKVSGLHFTPVKLHSKTARFDLEFLLMETEAGIIGEAEYSTDLFEYDTISRLLAHLRRVLETISLDPERRLSEIPMLGPAEQHELEEWNHTRRAYGSSEKCLHELFEEQVERTPEATALIFGGEQLTYQKLNERSNRLARYLRFLGVGAETLVGVCAERSIEMVVSLYAILKSGGAYVPLDPSYPADRLVYMLEDSGVSVLLTQQKFDKKLPSHDARVIVMDGDCPAFQEFAPGNLPVVTVPDNLVYVIYTSGSTGKPKGAMNTHRGLHNRLAWMQEEYGLEAEDTVLQKTPFSFDVSAWEFFCPLMYGARLVVARPGGHQEPDYLAELICAQKVTTIHFVPSMLQAFVEEAQAGRCSGLKRVICSGEALSKGLADRFFELLPAQLHNLYGPTEASIEVTHWACERGSSLRTVPIGRPIANTQIYIVDGEQELVPAGVIGQLHIAGTGLARGYLNKPDLTAERFIPNPFSLEPGGRLYRTGDLARYLRDGSIEYMGRMDFQVKLRGIRIELGEIDSEVARHPAIHQCVTVAREARPGEKRLVSYLVVNPSQIHDSDLGKLRESQVSEWEKVFDNTYGQGRSSTSAAFNSIGWNSSYTGEAIPEPEMREWLDDTVAGIRALHPQRVLEIGCGTGLILFRIAPHCVHYHGTDLSRTGLDYIQQQVARSGLTNVTLSQCPAHDQGLDPQTFDVVILNSVIQYFPNADYLVDVIQKVIALLRPGGYFFIGDVRSLPLYQSFRASVELHRAGAALPLDALRESIHAQSSRESELQVDPQFFVALQKNVPEIGWVEILPKSCRSTNELVRFRYQVVFQTRPGTTNEAEIKHWLDWNTEKLTLEKLRERLRHSTEDVGVLGIPNRQLIAEVKLLELLTRPDGIRTVGDMRQKLAGEEVHGADPTILHETASACGYVARISWARHKSDGRYDVFFRKNNGRAFTPVFPPGDGAPPRAWKEYVNDPLAARLTRELIPQLRIYLKKRLPDYMVPTQYVVLSEMPLTPSGKIDRRALPAPEKNLPECENGLPRTESEKIMANIWAEVLGLERIGIHDNFFELGGDSILTIRVISRASRAGFQLTVKQIFANQTIAELVAMSNRIPSARSEPESSAGRAILTPIQHWFFERSLTSVDWFNQAVLLEMNPGVDPGNVEHALRVVLEAHRLDSPRFVNDRARWAVRRVQARWDGMTVVDLATLNEESRQACLKADCMAVQGSLNISAGPLVRVAWFDLGGQGVRLQIVIHHLVVDLYSWRILLEDFENAMESVHSRDAFEILPPTLNYFGWAEKLAARASSRPLPEQIGRWFEETSDAAEFFPPFSEKLNKVRHARVLSFSLHATETTNLLRSFSRPESVQVSDLLLVAAAWALMEWRGRNSICISVEGHGRDDLFGHTDASRTVGWFTSLFPVKLENRSTTSFRDFAESSCHTLRRYREQGIHYGLYRYLMGGHQISNTREPQICYNYIGRMQQGQGRGRWFRIAAETAGENRDPDNPCLYPLEITGSISGGSLRIRFEFNPEAISSGDMEQVGRKTLDLIGFLLHESRPLLRQLDLSDFPLARISEKEFQSLAKLEPFLEDLYPLSPLQDSMLLNSLLFPQSDAFLEQCVVELTGGLQRDVLYRAWNNLIQRHAILRTGFHYENFQTAHQVVLSQVDIPWYEVDLTNLSNEQSDYERIFWLRQDRRQTFEMQRPPLFRFLLFDLEPHKVIFNWSYHHILFDGWSISLLFEQLFKTYHGVIAGGKEDEPAQPSFKSYIQWFSQQNLTQAEHFWRSELKGFSTPLRLWIDQGGSSRNVREFSMQMPAAATAKLVAFGQKHQLTLNTIVEGCWALLLSCYSDRSDVLFGTTSAGRPPHLPDVEQIVGLFINTLPLRVDVNPESTFIGFLRHLQEKQSNLREFDFTPLNRIQACSEVPRGRALFDSLMIFENLHHQELDRTLLGGLSLKALKTAGGAHNPLTLIVFPGAELSFLVRYHEMRYPEQSLRELMEDFRKLLDTVIEQKDAQLFKIPLFSRNEIRHNFQVPTDAETEQFWRRQLRDFTTPVRLSPPEHVVLVPGTKKIICPLPGGTTERLKNICHLYQLSLNAVVQGACAVLFNHYSGQEDVLFGMTTVPGSRSDQNESERRLSIVPLRVAIDKTARLLTWLQELEKRQPELQKFQSVSPAQTQSWSELPSEIPLYEILLAFVHDLSVNITVAEAGEKISGGKILLTVRVVLEPKLEIRIDYDDGRFAPDMITRFNQHLGMLLATMAEKLHQPIRNLSLLSAEHRHELLRTWNSTQREYPSMKCVHEVIEEQVERTPERAAIVYEGQTLTYRELNERANQLAHYLRRQGVGPEVRVGICVERSLEMVVGLLGILKAGGAYVPLDPGYPKERLEFMLGNARVKILLAQERVAEKLGISFPEVLRLDSDWKKVCGQSSLNPAFVTVPDNLVYVIYTSGSTGKPKGAMNTHRGLHNRLAWMQEEYGLEAEDTVLQKTPFSFDVSVWEFFWPLMYGARLVVARPGGHQEPDYLAELICAQKVTTIHFVPSMLQAFVEEAQAGRCSGLKRVICSGEALSKGLADRFFELLPAQLHNLYGPTEASIDVTYWACKRGSSLRTVPIGRPIANTQIYIVDGEQELVPAGVIGQLHIAGTGLARGYLNKPDLTAERFIPNPFSLEPGGRLYRTGDLARYLGDGSIDYLGRIDHQVKLRGFRIELGEIETVLAQHPAVRECVVLLRTDSEDKYLTAYVTNKPGTHPTPAEFASFLQTKLQAYMVPSAFVTLEAFPLTPNGKIHRQALPVPLHKGFQVKDNFVPAGTPNEEKLVEIWRRILNLEKIGIRDNFFALGGDSLSAVRVVVQTRETFGIEMPLSVLFTGNFTTVENFAKLVTCRQLEQLDDAELTRMLADLENIPGDDVESR